MLKRERILKDQLQNIIEMLVWHRRKSFGLPWWEGQMLFLLDGVLHLEFWLTLLGLAHSVGQVKTILLFDLM